MEKILDRLERIARRWFALVCVSIMLLSVALSVAVHVATRHEKPGNLPEGAVHCPNCGTVMVIERKELDA